MMADDDPLWRLVQQSLERRIQKTSFAFDREKFRALAAAYKEDPATVIQRAWSRFPLVGLCDALKDSAFDYILDELLPKLTGFTLLLDIGKDAQSVVDHYLRTGDGGVFGDIPYFYRRAHGLDACVIESEPVEIAPLDFEKSDEEVRKIEELGRLRGLFRPGDDSEESKVPYKYGPWIDKVYALLRKAYELHIPTETFDHKDEGQVRSYFERSHLLYFSHHAHVINLGRDSVDPVKNEAIGKLMVIDHVAPGAILNMDQDDRLLDILRPLDPVPVCYDFETHPDLRQMLYSHRILQEIVGHSLFKKHDAIIVHPDLH